MTPLSPPLPLQPVGESPRKAKRKEIAQGMLALAEISSPTSKARYEAQAAELLK